MLRSFIIDTVKKITLELVYEIVDERTKDIYKEIEDVKKITESLRDQEHDNFKYLINKIDSNTSDLRIEIAQLRDETNEKFREVHQEIAQLRNETNKKFEEMHQEMAQLRDEIGNLNRRIDTLMAMFVSINDKLSKLTA